MNQVKRPKNRVVSKDLLAVLLFVSAVVAMTIVMYELVSRLGI